MQNRQQFPDIRCAHALLAANHAWAALAILEHSTEPGAGFIAQAIRNRQEHTAMAHMVAILAQEPLQGGASGLERAQGGLVGEEGVEAAQGAPKRAQACGAR